MSGRVFRSDESAYAVLGLMDGHRTMEDIWRLAARRLGDEMPSQDEVIALLARLHQSDLVVMDARPDLREMTNRRHRSARTRTLQKIKSPFSIRIPLFDPDRMLNRTLPWIGPMLSPAGGLAWVLLVLAGVIQAGIEWSSLSANISDRVISLENLALMLLVYPLIKAFHELGHAYAVKRWGGEVHEIGVLLLLFFPVPYVDASHSSAWPSKWQRAAVGAMGIIVELAIASIAMLVWANVETGLVTAIAFAVMVTAGLSTLLFNGNPLLRFDGYYVLSDLIEIPNLGPRSDALIGWLVKRHLFGIRKRKAPCSSPGEGIIMAAYSVMSFLYKIIIGFGIIFFIADHYFVFGTLLAALYFFQMLVLPLWKGGKYVLVAAESSHRRLRSISATTAVGALIAAALLFVPLPYRGLAQGVVWIPETARLVTESPGFVEAFNVKAGDQVSRGAELVVLRNDELRAKREMLTAQVAEYQARVAAEVKNGPASVQQARMQLDQTRAALALAKEREQGLVLRGPGDGLFVPLEGNSHADLYFKKGDTVGYVIDRSAPTTVRLAVTEYDADLIRARLQNMTARFVDQPMDTYEARILREVPAARDTLPSKALSTEGGGPFPLDPTDQERLRALEHLVVIECEVIDAPPLDRVGGRVIVRLDYGSAPMAEQVYRPLRQLLLRQLKL